MILIYEVYIDVYFIENMMLDAVLLTLVLLLLHEKITALRLAAGAFSGGAGAVLILISGVNYGIKYVMMVLLLDCIMLMISMKRKEKHKVDFGQLAMGIIYLHGMAFAYGKLMECVARLGGAGKTRMTVTFAGTGIVIFMLIYNKIKEKKCIYEVTLTQNGENIKIMALLDTGNLLTDPISGRPVSVMEETNVIKNWMETNPHKYKIIPYNSIGNEHGILEGMMIDELIIQKEKEQVVKKETIVALYKGKLSKDESFQMILNHSLI